MSPEQLKEEIRKCREDAAYFIKNYVYITHPIRGRVKFDLYRFQERIVNEKVSAGRSNNNMRRICSVVHNL